MWNRKRRKDNLQAQLAENSSSELNAPVNAPEQREDTDKPSPERVSLRAILLGLLFIPANAFCIVWLENVDNARYRVMGPYPTVVSLVFTAVISLFLLIIVNQLASLALRRTWLSPFELLVVYCMTVAGSIFASGNVLGWLVSRMAYVSQALATGNTTMQTLIPYLPQIGLVNATEPVKAFYAGNSSLYSHGHWKAWLGPCAVWIGYISLMVFVMLCINAIVMRQWSRHERLSFPVTQLPLAMTTERPSVFRNKLLWIAFGLAAGINIWNGLQRSYLYFLPYLPVNMQALTLPNVHPWNGMGEIFTTANPWVIGIGFFVPLDLLFNMWFFYWFWKLEYLIFAMFGYSQSNANTSMHYPPYFYHQTVAVYFVSIAFVLWTGRNYWRKIFRSALHPNEASPADNDAMPPRLAVFGGLIGFVALVIFTTFFGLSLLLSIVLLLIFFVAVLAVTRVRAEFGALDPAFPFLQDLMVDFTGPGSYSKQDLVALGFMAWPSFGLHVRVMPTQLEAMRMAEKSGGSLRGMTLAIFIASIFGCAVSLWAFLHWIYIYGASARMYYWVGAQAGMFTFAPLSNWLASSQGFNFGALIGLSIGALFTVFNMLMRMRFMWWPFHPLGYALGATYWAHFLWMPLFISWVIKAFVMRYGGLRAYRTYLLPIGYGLILGDFTTGIAWAVYTMITGMKVYSFYP